MYVYICMLAIAGQTVFFSKFDLFLFHGQRRALQLKLIKTNYLFG